MWESCNISRFLGKFGCPQCQRTATTLRQSSPEAEDIETFCNTGAYREGTIFWKLPISFKAKCWAYHCPICSDDEFVEQGLCTGVFQTSRHNLLLGSLACRCSSRYRWTKEQRIYQVLERIKNDKLPYQFLGWKSEWLGNHTKLHMYCEKHGDYFPSIQTFIHERKKCPGCASHGFKPDKEAVLYVLRIEGQRNFTGYGISGDFHNRITRHTAVLAKEGLIISEITTFNMIGNLARCMEDQIKTNFDLYPQDLEGFKTEATYAYCHSELIDFIKLNLATQ